MTDDSSSDTVTLGVLEYALVFALGALLAGFATLAAWTRAYMGANPDVGSVSGSSELVLVVLFLAGVVAMFVAAGRALEAILQKHA